MSELEEIRNRLRDIIVNTCNKVGCGNCGLEWGDGCSATELQSKEMELEMEEYQQKYLDKKGDGNE